MLEAHDEVHLSAMPAPDLRVLQKSSSDREGGMKSTVCCKCSRRMFKLTFICPRCGHRLCESCKGMKRGL